MATETRNSKYKQTEDLWVFLGWKTKRFYVHCPSQGGTYDKLSLVKLTLLNKE